MLELNKTEIVKVLNAKKSGSKGWMLGDCPFCGKKGHLGLILSEVSSFSCKKCSEQGNIFKLLTHLGRLDLASSNYFSNPEQKLKEIEPVLEVEPTQVIELRPKPIGFKRLIKHSYLMERGFTKDQFDLFDIGQSTLEPHLNKDYLIFLVKNEKEECIGWVARSTKSKEEIDLINTKRKEKGINKKYLRWINSPDFQSNLILYGLNELGVTGLFCDTIILVEGITSKANIDNLLNLYLNPKIKCLASFGKKLSPEQIKLLVNFNIKKIILLQDPDAVNESKAHAFELMDYFLVKVGFIPFKKEDNSPKDPGDLNIEELDYVLKHLEDPLNFSLNKLAIKI